MTTHVIYHGNCFDGFGAAWAAWKKLGDTAEYVPASYGEDPPNLPPTANVVMVDFSYKRPVMEEFASKVNSLAILDHHKTAEDDLRGFPDAVFDMDRSGAHLSWLYFHPDEEVPELIKYVEDRDLWRWALPRSKEVSAAISSYKFDFEEWSKLDEVGVDSLILEGSVILRHKTQMIERMCEHYTIKRLGGHEVPVANATLYFSEVANRLCEKYPEYPFAAYYFDRLEDGRRQWGLRSNNGFDVSEIAKVYGGGGHQAAAGFTEPLKAESIEDLYDQLEGILEDSQFMLSSCGDKILIEV